MKRTVIICAIFLLSAAVCGAQPAVSPQPAGSTLQSLETTQQSSADTQQSSTPDPKKKLGGFTIAPAVRNVKNPATVYIEMKPGDTVEDSLIFQNNNAYEITLRLYAADGYTNDEGIWTIRQPTETQTSIGAWIQMAEAEIVLAPSEKKEVKYTVVIPPDAALGEYKGAVCGVRPADPGQKGGIAYSTRYALGAKILITDSPQHVWKVGEINIFESGTPYLWGSVAIFVAGMGYFIWGSLKERKKKKQLIK